MCKIWKDCWLCDQKLLSLKTCTQFQCVGYSSRIQSVASGDTVVSQGLKQLNTPTL